MWPPHGAANLENSHHQLAPLVGRENIMWLRRVFAISLMVSFLSVLLVGCTPTPAASDTPTPAAPATPTQATPQRLRIRNANTTEIKGLVVGFPKDRIEFGDIAPGSTTEYKAVPNGVLPYSAYSFEMDGQAKDQAVTDWIGVQLLPGNDFTYRVDFDPSRWSQNEAIRLLGVTTDR